MLEHMILGIVYQQDATGYDIKKIIETKICMFYKPSFGSLYPALKRLVEKDFLVTYEEMQGARKKIVYQITDSGRNSFMEWLALPLDLNEGADKNLVKIYFYDLLPAKTRNARLLQYEQDCMQYLENLEKLEKELYEKVNKKKDYYKLSTLFYGITVTRTSIAWCRAIREHVDLETLL